MLVDKPVPDSEQSETKSEAETENNGREFREGFWYLDSGMYIVYK